MRYFSLHLWHLLRWVELRPRKDILFWLLQWITWILGNGPPWYYRISTSLHRFWWFWLLQRDCCFLDWSWPQLSYSGLLLRRDLQEHPRTSHQPGWVIGRNRSFHLQELRYYSWVWNHGLIRIRNSWLKNFHPSIPSHSFTWFWHQLHHPDHHSIKIYLWLHSCIFCPEASWFP